MIPRISTERLPAIVLTTRKPGRPVKHNIGILAVGESMFIKATKATMKSLRHQHAPKRFSARQVVSNGVQGYRVLRVS